MLDKESVDSKVLVPVNKFRCKTSLDQERTPEEQKIVPDRRRVPLEYGKPDNCHWMCLFILVTCMRHDMYVCHHTLYVRRGLPLECG